MTRSQMVHLKAAEAGALYANWHGGPIRRWVMDDGKANKAVCERLLTEGLIRLVPEPGCTVLHRATTA